MTLKHEGRLLSRYEARVEAAAGELRAVARPRLFEVSHSSPRLRLFALDVLGEGGWLKVMRLEGYTASAPKQPQGLRQALFLYAEAL